uniref:Retrovirus-related Pol polyprotein from transposon TNT 1-94 n=1 Tax=Cajanus cajan TaxID=3821 RepID=A0A151QZF2_CAJCA|nr:Retrovirus-related Pol polyprotein from transposon TNT 1-94 [Cajanus cajan]
MKFWLTELNLFSVILNGKSENCSECALVEASSSSDKDILCHGHILSALSDNIYKIFCHTKPALELWDALELKYGSAEKGLRKYSCERIIYFQMEDGKPFSDQVHEFENIIYDMKMKEITLPDIMLVSLLISKLPPWFEFARSLKHKPDHFTLSYLLVTLQIEVKHHISQKVSNKTHFQAKAHLVENANKPKQKFFKKSGFSNNKFGQSSHFSKNKNKVFNNNYKPKSKIQGNESFCFVCGRNNHFAKDCFHRRRQPKDITSDSKFSSQPQANVITANASSDSPSNKYHVTILELNFVYNSNDWWIDSGANVHVCADKKLFSSYQECGTRTVSMGNGSLARVISLGRV